MTNSIPKRSLLNSLGVVIYVAMVAVIMQNGEQLFGQKNGLIPVVGFLLLFCVSAAVVGSLVFGYPVMLYFNGQKREAVSAAGYTVAWLMIETLVVLFSAIFLTNT